MKDDNKVTRYTSLLPNFLHIPKPKDAIPTLRDFFADLQYVLEKWLSLFFKYKVTEMIFF